MINPLVKPQKVVLILDTTYFKNFGILVAREPNLGQNLYFSVVERENLSEYQNAVFSLQKAGFSVSAIVADGFPGLKKLFPEIPFQKCHFHQFQTVTRYISKNPKLEAGSEFRNLIFSLKYAKKRDFKNDLNFWHQKWSNFLAEKSLNFKTGKYFYTHKRLRQAFFGVHRNFNDLFVFQDFPNLKIPNTTNSLDGFFGHLKSKIMSIWHSIHKCQFLRANLNW